MPGPLLPLAVAGGIAGLVAYLARRRQSRERPVLAELAIRMSGARMVGDELTVLHRGLDVAVGFGVPGSHAHFERGLFARAAYAIGGGPTFHASARDVSAHARRMGTGYPLSARFARGYDVVGDHQDARALVLPVLSRVHTGFLPAPLFVSSGHEITVHLPELIPEDDKLEVTEQLVALTGELAFFGYEHVERLRAQLGGSIVVEPRRRPSVVLRARWGEVAVEVSPTWDEFGTGVPGLGLILSAERGPRAMELTEAIATVPTIEDRRRATLLAKRARHEASRVSITFERLLGPEDLELMLGLLVRLAGQVARDSPFR